MIKTDLKFYIKSHCLYSGLNELEIVKILDDYSWFDMETNLQVELSKSEYVDLKHQINYYLLNIDWGKSINELSFVGLNENANLKNPSLLHKNINKLKQAISNRNYATVYYTDDDGNSGFRLLEPYGIFKGFKFDGKVVEAHKDDYYLRCYVIMDTLNDPTVGFKRSKSVSVSGDDPFWRTFRIDRINDLFIIKRKFRYYRRLYVGSKDKNAVVPIMFANINDFGGVNSY